MRVLLLILCFFGITSLSWAEEFPFHTQDWPQLSDKHFKVIYPSKSDEVLAGDVLRRAEEYYTSIAESIGYGRYQHFWTWDERVDIILFPNKEDFIRQTGQPAWAEGMAQPYSHFFKSRLIASFRDQPRFLTEVLPHEISHLILHDFMGFDKPVPLFFDEGFAQLAQQRDELNYLGILAHLATQGRLLSVASLLTFPLQEQKDPTVTAIFYAESLYIVDFLIKNYGKDKFKELCRSLRDGEDFGQALKSSYYPTMSSIDELQSKWTKYLLTYL